MIRVLHLITSLAVGGAQRMLSRLVEESDRERFSMRVVSLVDGGALAGDLAAAGVPVTGLGLRPGGIDPRGLVRFRRILGQDPPDVLQTWLYHADLLGALAVRGSNGPRLVWNLRCTDQAESSRRRLRRMVVWSCARLSGRPDVVVTNSRAGREFHAGLGYRPRRWEWIPNGFRLDRPPAGAREAIRRELGVADDELCALTLARWHPSKGVDVLLRALEGAGPAARRTCFVLAGDGLGAENGELRGLVVRAASSGARVLLLGIRDDVPRLLAGCDFLVSPSRFEGFPNAVGEALAAERPCVVTRAGDAAAVVGEAGLVVAPADAPALAAAIERMAGLPPAERARLGAIGRRRVTAEFSIDAVVSRYQGLYAELAERACAV